MQQKLLNFIKQRVNEASANMIVETLYAAYARAHVAACNEMETIGPERLRGYMRREFCNDSLAKLGEVRFTKPRGEVYGMLQCDSLNIITVCVDHDRQDRDAKYKSELAMSNKVLEPETVDMFDPATEHSSDSLHACLMIINSGYYDDPIKPRDIQLVVPFTNRKGFHLRVGVDEWLASYQSEPVVIADPWPTFRKEILEAEEKQSHEE